jgi:hypothetical protein
MAYNSWRVILWDKDDKEREFVLEIRDSKIAPGQKGSLRTSDPMSEDNLRRELADLAKEEVDAEITKARTMKP